jgi:hypothetical protein
MSATHRLDQIEERANAASPNYRLDSNGCCVLTDGAGEDAGMTFILVKRSGTPADLAFVSHSRRDVPDLAAALRAVLNVINDPGGPDSWSHTYQGRHAIFAEDVRQAIESALGGAK